MLPTIDQVKEFLSGSPTGKKIVDEITSSARNLNLQRRKQCEAEKRELLARQDKELPRASKAFETAREKVERIRAELKHAEEEALVAHQALSILGDTTRRKVDKLNDEIRSTAPAEFEAFLTDVITDIEAFRKNGALFGVSATALTTEGVQVTLALFRGVVNYVRDCQEDGDINDPLPVITALRDTYAARVTEVARVHDPRVINAMTRTQYEAYRREFARVHTIAITSSTLNGVDA